MKKNSLIGILILLVAFAMTYAKIKSNETEKVITELSSCTEGQTKLRDEAMELRQIAQEAAAQAKNQASLAKQALVDCQGK